MVVRGRPRGEKWNPMATAGTRVSLFARRLGALLLGLILCGGLLVAEASVAVAATGAFATVGFSQTADGYQLKNNPVDTSANNGIVGLNDQVGFQVHAITGGGTVSGATMSLSKPSCFIWDVSANQAFTISSGGTTASVTAPMPWDPTVDTLTMSWSQNANGDTTTAEFRATAGPTCADGTVWNPLLTVTDSNGTASYPSAAVTVRSVAGSDIAIQGIGSP